MLYTADSHDEAIAAVFDKDGDGNIYKSLQSVEEFIRMHLGENQDWSALKGSMLTTRASLAPSLEETGKVSGWSGYGFSFGLPTYQQNIENAREDYEVLPTEEKIRLGLDNVTDFLNYKDCEQAVAQALWESSKANQVLQAVKGNLAYRLLPFVNASEAVDNFVYSKVGFRPSDAFTAIAMAGGPAYMKGLSFMTAESMRYLSVSSQYYARLALLNGIVKCDGPKTWNDFQSAAKGLYNTKADVAKAWEAYKTKNEIVSGTLRNSAQKTAFLKLLSKNGKAPAWMNQFLNTGKVPPGYQVDHILPLSSGGADIPGNMRLKLISDHVNWHKLYRPWNQ